MLYSRKLRRRQRWLVATVASLVVASAPLFLFAHNSSGDAHPLTDLCPACTLFHGNGHAPPPTIPGLATATPVFSQVAVPVNPVVRIRLVGAGRPRAPPIV